MLVTIVSFVLVLGVLVFFHELGHYWVARRNGIVVEEFGMGYPPRLVKLFTYDGTDFTINLIPFGGFARMKGEDAGDMSPGSFNGAGKGARAATLIAGPFMNAVLAIILFAGSFMAGFPAPVAYAQIAADAASSELSALGLQPGDIVLKRNDEAVLMPITPDADYNVMARKSAASASGAEQTLVISRNDEIVTLAIPNDVDVEALLKSVSYVPILFTKITLVAPDSPASEAQLKDGDIFYKVNGAMVTPDHLLTELVQDNAGSPTDVTLLRDGQEWVTVTMTPRVDPPAGQGSLGVGIDGLTQLARLPLLSATMEGVRNTFEYFALVLQLPFLLISGQMAPSDAELTGPVGIAQMVGSATQATIDTGLLFPILRLSAILSAALAVTNLLPLPALDGGRLLFILIETIRGRRVSPEREGFVHMVGYVLLLGLIVFITVRDISTVRQGIDWISILGQ
ncbi:MAG: RIP metalloprotease RseP [Caldilineaceae bacterium]|nr:RIP metalloprotease RseP [Caldilineaceae bacterium]